MEPEIMLWITFIRIVGLFVCISVAGKKNRSKLGWGFFGFAIPVIAIIIILLLKPLPAANEIEQVSQ